MQSALSNRILGILFTLLALASAAVAVTPLSQPDGLAVDAHGNLYVANYGSNNILIYNPSYQQLTTRTITSGINRPLAVATDPVGNLWVQNQDPKDQTAFLMTEYSPSGANITTSNQIGFTLLSPNFAIDGVGDVWVTSVFRTGNALLVMNPPSGYDPNILDEMFVVGGTYTCLAAHGEWVAMATPQTITWALTGATLTNSVDLAAFRSSEPAGFGVEAMTFDNLARLYIALSDGGTGTIIQSVITPTGGSPIQKLTLNSQIAAMAADSDRNRLYLANPTTNQIEVYSTTTWRLLTTIQ